MASRPLFESCPTQGDLLQPYEQLPVGSPAHQLGGLAETDSACPNCDQPITLLLRLDSSDIRLSLPATAQSRLDLLTCRSCGAANYTITSAGEVLMLPSTPDVPRINQFEPTPPAATLVMLHAIPDRIVETRRLALESRLSEAANWAERFDWHTPVNQVGGVPLGSNPGASLPVCSLCDQPMPYLASVVDQPPDDSGLLGAAWHQTLFHLCRNCIAVTALRDFPLGEVS
jgi:hypothetical protein